jgi:hypothetical protein
MNGIGTTTQMQPGFSRHRPPRLEPHVEETALAMKQFPASLRLLDQIKVVL